MTPEEENRKIKDRRKYSKEKVKYPFYDSDGNRVTQNRRRVVDRRTHDNRDDNNKSEKP